MEIELSDETDQEETDEAHQNALYHRTSVMAQGMDVGEIGAVATSDERCPDGYYLLEFSSLPYTEQDGTGSLKCKGYWMYKLPMAPHWYYTSYREEVAVDLMNVVMAGVEMEKMGDGNYPPLGMRKEAEDNNARKINLGCHNQILDEIVNRERLEYDPTRVYTDQKEEDEDSDID